MIVLKFLLLQFKEMLDGRVKTLHPKIMLEYYTIEQIKFIRVK